MQKVTPTLRSKWWLVFAALLIATSVVGCAESISKKAESMSRKAYRKGLSNLYNYNYDAAIAEFSTAISQGQDHAEYYYQRGVAYIGQKNTAAAIADLNKVLELAPNFVNAYFRRAVAYSAAGRYKDAIADSDKVLEMYPGASGAYGQLIRDYQNLGDDKKALELSELYAKNAPDERESFEQVWDAATKAHDQEKRLWACDQLERFNSSNFHNAWHNRGIVLYEQGKYQQAIENFSKAIKRSGFEDDCTFQRGLAKAALNRNTEALADFDKCIKLQNRGEYFGARGVAAYFLGKYDDAIRDLSKAISMDCHSYRPYRGYYKYRALAYDKKGLKDLAKKDRISFAKLQPPLPQNPDPLPPNWR